MSKFSVGDIVNIKGYPNHIGTVIESSSERCVVKFPDSKGKLFDVPYENLDIERWLELHTLGIMTEWLDSL